MPTVESILLKKGPDVIGVGPDATVRQAVGKMAESNVGCVIVEKDARAVGVFTERDLLRRVVDADKDPDATRISEVMTSPVCSCKPSDDVGDCFDQLRTQQHRHLMVLDNDEPVGVISLRDVAMLLRDSAT